MKPKRPKFEAEGQKQRRGSESEEGIASHSHQLGCLRERCKLPSRILSTRESAGSLFDTDCLCILVQLLMLQPQWSQPTLHHLLVPLH